MLYTRTIIVSLTILLLATSLPASAERSEDGRYIASDVITIYCGAEPHSLVPQGDPQGPDSPTGWLFSGEPECVFSDALNALEDDAKPSGYGGYAWVWDDDQKFPVGDAFTVTTIDDAFGTGNSYLQVFQDTSSGERNSVEGCGSQTLELQPPDAHWYWEPWPDYVWAQIPPIGVEADLTPCFASKGLVESALTPA